MSEHTKDDNNISALLMGVAIGAAVTYMFTTKNGQKIKDEILKEGSKVLGSIGDEIDKVKTEVEEKKEEATKQLVDNVQEVKEKVEEAVENVQNIATQELPEQVEKLQKKGRRYFFSKKSPPSES